MNIHLYLHGISNHSAPSVPLLLVRRVEMVCCQMSASNIRTSWPWLILDSKGKNTLHLDSHDFGALWSRR